MRQQEKWHALLGPTFRGTPYELVGVECVTGGRQVRVCVYVDKPGGITIDDIAKLSRELSWVMEVESPIRGPYALEVSSPGLDRQLFLPQQFPAYVGSKLAIKTALPQEGRQNFRGVLRSASDEGITLEVDNILLTLRYSEIDKAKVVPEIKIPSGK